MSSIHTTNMTWSKAAGVINKTMTFGTVLLLMSQHFSIYIQLSFYNICLPIF